MALKWFVIGRPGSGKTTSARYIIQLAKNKGLSAIHMNDYEILKQMFRDDIEQKKFRPTEHEGFDVLDFSVMQTALQELERSVESYISSMDLITIEFARDDYDAALKQFHPDFLRKDACFLYLDADIEICLQRIHERITCCSSVDDHPSLSDNSFRSHYQKDNRSYITSNLKNDYAIDEQRIMVIDNIGSYVELINKLNQFVETIPLPTLI